MRESPTTRPNHALQRTAAGPSGLAVESARSRCCLSGLQSTRPVGRVAELGSLGRLIRPCFPHSKDFSEPTQTSRQCRCAAGRYFSGGAAFGCRRARTRRLPCPVSCCVRASRLAASSTCRRCLRLDFVSEQTRPLRRHSRLRAGHTVELHRSSDALLIADDDRERVFYVLSHNAAYPCAAENGGGPSRFHSHHDTPLPQMRDVLTESAEGELQLCSRPHGVSHRSWSSACENATPCGRARPAISCSLTAGSRTPSAVIGLSGLWCCSAGDDARRLALPSLFAESR